MSSAGTGFTFAPAARTKAKARVALTGPAGSGKTKGALWIAAGLGGRVAVIDTESQSASLYVGQPGIPAYDVCVIEPPFHPNRYIEAIHAAEAAGYDVIIVDSLSHAWMGTGGALEIKDVVATGKGQNSYTAWNEVGKLQNHLTDAILRSPKHIIATMRSKQEYVLEENEKGKKVPKKVGMAPQQRDGLEYEFTLVLDLSIDHTAAVSKDRTAMFDGTWFKVTVDVGVALKAWLDTGSAANVAATFPTTPPNGGNGGHAAAPAPAQVVVKPKCSEATLNTVKAHAKAAGLGTPGALRLELPKILGRPATLNDIDEKEAALVVAELRRHAASPRTVTTLVPAPAPTPTVHPREEDDDKYDLRGDPGEEGDAGSGDGAGGNVDGGDIGGRA